MTAGKGLESKTCTALVVVLVLAPVAYQELSSAGCPFDCTCTNQTLDCRSRNLTATPIDIPKNIEVFLYSDNRVSHLRLNYNHYQTKPGLKLVDLSQNQIATTENYVFGYLDQMTHLNLAMNKLDENTFGSDPDHLFESTNALQFINFSRNAFKVLPIHLFDGRYMNSLEGLDLSRNSIHTIKKDAISNQRTLKTLDLSFNQITILSPDSCNLTQLPSVEVLSLNNNQITSVKISAFKSMNSLQQLHLENNRIVEIQKKSFMDINVHTLNLANNQLQHVHKSALRDLHKLENLILDNNPLLSLNNRNFLTSKTLKFLSISHMIKLRSVNSMAFKHLPSLEELNMHNNSALESIHPQAFHGKMFNRIKQVNLSNNSLKWLPRELLPWGNLTSLDLKGNPWVCNCSMLWAKAQPNIQVICKSPPSLLTQRLSGLSYEDLGCGQSTNISLLVIVAISISVIVVLVAVAVCTVLYRRRSQYQPLKETNARMTVSTSYI